MPTGGCPKSKPVSTHSRLKAAGYAIICCLHNLTSFNTQPPEGGWLSTCGASRQQAVSTHSRLKAAGYRSTYRFFPVIVSTHSRLKAAGQIAYQAYTGKAFQHTAA